MSEDTGSKTDVFVTPTEGPPELRTVAFWDTNVITRRLTPGGQLVIGRSPECDLRVDHPSVSRRHARIHVGDVIRVEDLGSANGTLVGDRTLREGQSVEWIPGELTQVGAATLFLQSAGGGQSLPTARVRAAGAGSPWPPTGPMARIHQVLELVAPGEITVLLLGETGVGKELAADVVHRHSRRANKAFVQLNCAALPETLLESELFGYDRGAFTGADRAKPGLLETADGGTVFLDEVGEMPLATQAKLLRVLESRQVSRLGALAPRSIDVRFIAATNRDLGEQVNAGTFRKDLLFRLSGMPVYLPPLRERTDEIVPLAQRFVEESSARLGRPSSRLGPAALEALRRYGWPGNVRELKNVMERAVLLANRGTIEPDHLALEVPMTLGGAGSVPASVPPPPSSESGDLNLRRAMAGYERERITQALEHAGGNQTRAAELLGISRRALVAKIAEYGLGKKRR
jgi:transcriptional regulator with AAA-type ATPase domain